MFATLSWSEMFAPGVSFTEIVVRGSLMYLSIFIMLRVVLRRQSGGIGITDVLVVVLLSDAAQNGMTGNYTSITDGIVLIAVIVFWSYALDLLAYKIPALERFLHPPRLPLVKNGRLLRGNMRQELITVEELLSQLRKEGIENLAEVRLAYMEPDGEISVIKNSEQG